ncbi:MAG: hypothetical protein U1E65_19110 [Myxococcota bacterium]
MKSTRLLWGGILSTTLIACGGTEGFDSDSAPVTSPPPPLPCVLQFTVTPARPDYQVTVSTPYACFLACRYTTGLDSEKGSCRFNSREVYTFIGRSGTDSDLDGLPDTWETARGTLIDQRDSDRDGMEDGWEHFYAKIYGSTDLSPTADLDGDGRSNLDEFLLGTNPILADSSSFSMITLPGIGDRGAIFARGGNRYQLESSTGGGAWTFVQAFEGLDGIISLSGSATTNYRWLNASVWIGPTPSTPSPSIPPSDRFYAINGASSTELDDLLRSFEAGQSRALPTNSTGKSMPAVIHLMAGAFTTSGIVSARGVNMETVRTSICNTDPVCWSQHSAVSQDPRNNVATHWSLHSQWSLRGAGRRSGTAGTLLELATQRAEMGYFTAPGATDVSRITMVGGAEDWEEARYNQHVRDLSMNGHFDAINRVPSTTYATVTIPLKVNIAGINLHGSYSTIENVELHNFGTDNFWFASPSEPWIYDGNLTPGECFVAYIGGEAARGISESYVGMRIASSDYIGPTSYEAIPSARNHTTTVFMTTGGWVGQWEFGRSQAAPFTPGVMNPAIGAELIGNRCLASRRTADLSTGTGTGLTLQEIRDSLEFNPMQCFSSYETTSALVRSNSTSATAVGFWGDTVKAKNVRVDTNNFLDARFGVLLGVGGAHNQSYEDLVITNNTITVNVWSHEDHKWGGGIVLSGLPLPWFWLPSDETVAAYSGLRNVHIIHNRVSISSNIGDTLGTPVGNFGSDRDVLGISTHTVGGTLEIVDNRIDDRIPPMFNNSGRIFLWHNSYVDDATGAVLYDRGALSNLTSSGNLSWTVATGQTAPLTQAKAGNETYHAGVATTGNPQVYFNALGRTGQQIVSTSPAALVPIQ